MRPNGLNDKKIKNIFSGFFKGVTKNIIMDLSAISQNKGDRK